MTVCTLDSESVGSGVRMVLAHGFTQNRACWGSFGDGLGAHFRTVRVDLPGHGGSTSVKADVAGGARLLGEAGGKAIYLGYSMGGRLVLSLLLQRPELVRGAVFIGANPGIDEPEARRERRLRDEALADRIETHGLESFLDDWLRLPLFQRLSPEAAGLSARLRNDATAIAASLRDAGTGTQEPLWSGLPGIRVPTLWIAGNLDLAYRRVVERAARACGGRASRILVPEVGHAAHLEAPVRVADEIAAWARQEGLLHAESGEGTDPL